MKQRQGGAPGKDAGAQQPAVAEEARPPGKGWGQGSATALESLKKRDYRGRRSKPADERPAAE